MADKATWKCDSCHTNNYEDAEFCRVCQLEPGSATGATEVVVHEPQQPEAQPRPKFVSSRHGPAPRPTITLTPVPPKPVPPSRRPAAPPPRPAPARPRPLVPRATAKKLTKVALGLVALLVLAANLPRLTALLPDASTLGTAPSATAPACPGEVARWLPESGASAVLIAQYDTGQHVVTVCRDNGGQYHYDGQVKGKAATSETHISLTATPTASGFQARNANYLYEIDGLDLRLTKSGKPVKSWQLTRLAP
ncbi:hypothetical protein [Amycolatopsis sp. cmx-4-61]|uniref:hypothetical protein n=1 Tax=Amycolatopsis sp. cmx-4-61 TaxID=2790937 RepID=UPI00397C81A0